MKEFRLTINGRNILVRPRKEGEAYPTHTASRVLIGRTIHVVKGCNAHALAMKLMYEPEKKWRKCPSCGQKEWAVWLPVPIPNREWFDEEERNTPFWTPLQWYIICIHCSSVIDQEHNYDLYAGEPTEYVYDPADDVDFSTLSSRLIKSKSRKLKT